MAEENQQIDYMRKKRFDEIKTKFDNISEEATKIIDSAQPDDILSLTMTFRNPVNIIAARVCSEKDFIETVF